MIVCFLQNVHGAIHILALCQGTTLTNDQTHCTALLSVYAVWPRPYAGFALLSVLIAVQAETGIGQIWAIMPADTTVLFYCVRLLAAQCTRSGVHSVALRNSSFLIFGS